jgi:hypothetical protein
MLLDHIGETPAAKLVDSAVRELLQSKRLPSLGANSGLSTEEVGDMVVKEVEGLSARSSPAEPRGTEIEPESSRLKGIIRNRWTHPG